MKRWVAALLAAAFLVSGLPLPARAGSTVESSDAANVEVGDSGSSDSSLNKEFALGLFIVAVAVFLWVGFREDVGWWSRSPRQGTAEQEVAAPRCRLVPLVEETERPSGAGAAVALAWDF